MEIEKTVEITPEDIMNGFPLIPTRDPLAAALRRAFSVEFASVSVDYAIVSKDEKFFRIDLPLDIQQCIIDYDVGKGMAPRKFLARTREIRKEDLRKIGSL